MYSVYPEDGKDTQCYDAMAGDHKKYANCNGVLFLERDGKTGLNDTKLVIPPELFLELCEENKSVAFCRVTDKKDVNYRYLRRYSAFGAPLTQGKVIWAYLVIFLPRQVLSTQAEMVSGGICQILFHQL